MARKIALASLVLTLGLTGPLGCSSNRPAVDSELGTLSARLADPARRAEDRARDPGRKPAAVVAFLGIEPGMTVIDLIAAGGYYTEVLSLAVGAGGKVISQNNAYVLELREGAVGRELTARLAGGRLANVRRLDQAVSELSLAPESLDAAFTALNFHDIYNSRGPEAAQAFLAVVYEMLKPGGVFGIIDHSGAADRDNTTLHRIEEQLVIDAVIEAGFVLEGESALLSNDSDDRSGSVFQPGLRGRTDRFLLRLRKPARAS